MYCSDFIAFTILYCNDPMYATLGPMVFMEEKWDINMINK